ncbi:MAG: hypothetical protein CMD02_03810 [Flavobacteriales bacterium]|nr:hypothetical protein [Flavobacteriales bacterium]
MHKVAFITGTGDGIGRSLAQLLLEKGYVVFGYSRKNKLKHPNFNFTKIDLSNIESVQNINFPEIKCKEIILINNAATIGKIVPIHLKTTQEIVHEYNVNIITPTILCNKFINKYLNYKKTIINISSGAAIKSIPSWNTYSATKAALDRLTDTISKENIPNLEIFSIHPGIVDTNMQKRIRDSDSDKFPLKEQFIKFYKTDQLEDPRVVSRKIFIVINNPGIFKENILSARNIEIS